MISRLNISGRSRLHIERSIVPALWHSENSVVPHPVIFDHDGKATRSRISQPPVWREGAAVAAPRMTLFSQPPVRRPVYG
jgi:hypothetical protein